MRYSIYRTLVLASVLPLAERVREEMQQLFDEHRLLMEQTVHVVFRPKWHSG